MNTPAPSGPRILGFVDIGTNSVRLIVTRIYPERTWIVIDRQKESVRLGEGEFGAMSVLQPEAMTKAITVCRTFVQLARAHGAAEIVAAATAATREAVNQGTFLRRLRDEADLDVHVVSGPEEARLIYLGVLTKVRLDDRRALVIDIGGGSTEIALGDAKGPRVLDSLKLGAIRLTTEFPEAAGGPVSSEVWHAMRRRAQVEAARTRRALDGQRINVAFGTSGTIRNLAALAAQTGNGSGSAAGVLRRSDLRTIARQLRAATVAERRALPGLTAERADIIVAGAAILDALMEDLGLTEIQALPDCGLREGMVLDFIRRSQAADTTAGENVRERSVSRLARAASIDERHARHVVHLATSLFDSAAAAQLHPFGQAERELLSYAALLHDAGTFLSYTEHHAHSYYLIRHADLLGFDEHEVAIIAATALFHRKSRPRARHEALRELDRRSRAVVRTLSAYLRLAEYLDRGHAGAVAHAALRKDGKDAVALDVTPARDWHLERWRLQDRQAAIEDALGYPVNVHEADTPATSIRETP